MNVDDSSIMLIKQRIALSGMRLFTAPCEFLRAVVSEETRLETLTIVR